MRRLLQTELVGVSFSWGALVVILVATGWSLVHGAFRWVLFGLGLAGILLITPVVYRSGRVMPSWPVTVLAALPFAVGVAAPGGPVEQFAASMAVAAMALVVATQVDTFTRVRMNRGVTVGFVVMTTLTAAGTWEIGKWLLDVTMGTSLIGGNDALMWRLITSAIAGIIAGLFFDWYLKRLPQSTLVPDGFDIEDVDDQLDDTGDHVSEVLETVGLSTDLQRALVRGLQLVLVGILAVGIVTLEVNVIVNASVGLGATFLPTLLRRDWNARMDIGLTLWIAIAVVLHTLGTLAFYQTVWGWHKVTHATSGTLVAGIGYTFVRALETHTDSIAFPPRFTFVIVVLFVFSVGVTWEILEFAIDQLVAAAGKEEVVLSQHGLDDTTSDMIANTVGALVAAGAATAYRFR